eukprot:UN28505
MEAKRREEEARLRKEQGIPEPEQQNSKNRNKLSGCKSNNFNLFDGLNVGKVDDKNNTSSMFGDMNIRTNNNDNNNNHGEPSGGMFSFIDNSDNAPQNTAQPPTSSGFSFISSPPPTQSNQTNESISSGFGFISSPVVETNTSSNTIQQQTSQQTNTVNSSGFSFCK